MNHNLALDDMIRFIRAYQHDPNHPYSPNISEIASAIGYSDSGVRRLRDELIAIGRLRRGKKGSARTLVVVEPTPYSNKSGLR